MISIQDFVNTALGIQAIKVIDRTTRKRLFVGTCSELSFIIENFDVANRFIIKFCTVDDVVEIVVY